MTPAKIKVDFIGNKTIDPIDLIKEKYENGQLKKDGLGLNNFEVEITTEKMPDTIWAYRQDTGAKVWSLRHKAHHHRFIPYRKTMYYRAEPVAALLKQCLPYIKEAENYELANDINKFLGEK